MVAVVTLASADSAEAGDCAQAVRRALGTAVGDAAFDSEADLNSDGFVNSIDAAICSGVPGSDGGTAGARLAALQFDATDLYPAAGDSFRLKLSVADCAVPLFGYSAAVRVLPLTGATGTVTASAPLTSFFPPRNVILAAPSAPVLDPTFSLILPLPQGGVFINANTADGSTVLPVAPVNDVLGEAAFGVSSDARGIFLIQFGSSSALAAAGGQAVPFESGYAQVSVGPRLTVSATSTATSVAPGGELIVRLSASEPLTTLGRARFAVHFDATRLRLNSASPAPGGPLSVEVAESIDQPAGTLVYEVASATATSGLQTAGLVAELRFTVISAATECELGGLVSFAPIGAESTRFTTLAQTSVTPLTADLGPISLDGQGPAVESPVGKLSAPVASNCFAELPVLTGAVVASDDCTVASRLVISQSPAPGTAMALGVHPVSFSVVDEAGNTTTVVASFEATGLRSTYYGDSDMDGAGDSAVTQSACAQPAGYVANSNDGCPSNGALTSPATYYRDADSDTYGNSAVSESTCSSTPSTGYVSNSADCDDSRATANPAAAELCNGLDDDCDLQVDDGLTFVSYYGDSDMDGAGDPAVFQSACAQPAGYVANSNDGCPSNGSLTSPATYYRDADSDTYGSTAVTESTCSSTPSTGYVSNSTDCDDSRATANPAAAELCNGLDDDCDLQVDDGLTFVTYYGDGDMDGAGDPAVTQSACTQPAGYVINANDGCPSNGSLTSPATYYRDADSDTYGNPAVTESTCSSTPSGGYVAVPGDCRDHDPNVHPGVAEACGNGVDDNCNGQFDEDCDSFSVILTGSSTGISPGEQFFVRVACSRPPVSVVGFQLALRFDASRLRLDAVEPVSPTSMQQEIAELIDNPNGTLRYALGVTDPRSPVVEATDLCDLVFSVLPGASGCGSAELVSFDTIGGITTTFVSSDSGGNVAPTLFDLQPVGLDATPPVLSVALATDITVPTDAGSVYGAAIPEPTVVAIDDCDSDVSVSRAVTLAGGAVVTEWPAVFPIGISTVEWIAIDDAGNYVSAVRTITVEPYHLLEARVTLNAFLSGHSNREIRFSADGHIFGSIVTIPPGIGGVGITEIALPVAAMHPCVAAKAPTHSLTSTAVPVIVGARYRADFALIQGDSNDDDMIEIVDYAMFVIDLSTPGNFDRPPDARSNFNGDRFVNAVDFSFIGTGFFNVGESCTGALASARPRERISVKELRRTGLGELTGADLNRDGWFDMRDIQIAVRGSAGGGGAVAQPAAAEEAGVQW
jgi:hypothetical protein